MKTKLISLVVAVVIVVSDFSVVLAAGIPIGPRPWPKNRNCEKQVSGRVDQLAYIIFGSPRRRNYESAVSNKTDQLAYIIYGSPRGRKKL